MIIHGRDTGWYAWIAGEQQTLGRVRIHGRLMAGIPGVQAIANFRIRGIDLVTQPVVEGQVRRHAELILRIASADPLAESAVELAAALEELHGLA